MFEKLIENTFNVTQSSIAEMSANMEYYWHIPSPYDKSIDAVFDSIENEKPIIVYDCLNSG